MGGKTWARLNNHPTGEVLPSTIALVDTVVLKLIRLILDLSYSEISSSKVVQMDSNRLFLLVGFFYCIYDFAILYNNCIYMGAPHI